MIIFYSLLVVDSLISYNFAMDNNLKSKSTAIEHNLPYNRIKKNRAFRSEKSTINLIQSSQKNKYSLFGESIVPL